MSGAQLTNELTALLVNRVPAWYHVDLAGYLDKAPITGDAGIELRGAPRLRLFASARQVQDRRTGFIFLGLADTTDTYSITVNANPPAVFDAAAGGAASAADIYDGIFDAFDALAIAAFNVEKLTDADGRTNGLKIYIDGSGDAAAPSTFAVTAFSTLGAGILLIHLEPTSFDMSLWITAVRGRSDGPPDAAHWVQIFSRDTVTFAGLFGYLDFDPTPLNKRCDMQLDTAGAERVAAVVGAFVPGNGSDAAGILPAFHIHLGPSTDETVDLSAQSGGNP